MGDLTGKVAIITGAGRGLGREEALQLARQGARVVINDINLPDAVEAAQSALEEIKGFGGEAIAVFGDCADSSDAYNLMTTTLETFGDINIMVNNAGFCRDKTIFGMSDDEFDSVWRRLGHEDRVAEEIDAVCRVDPVNDIGHFTAGCRGDELQPHLVGIEQIANASGK